MKQVLDFIKTNAVALTCGVVALLAIFAVFVWPVPGMFGQLQEQVAARTQTHTGLTGLLQAQRTLPNLDPGVTEPAPLTAFPNRPVIAQGQKAMEQVRDAAKVVLAAAVKMNARTPLVPDALPNPSSLARNNFFDAYRVATAQYGPNADRGIIRTVLHGTLPPTQEEITAIGGARANEIRRTSLQLDNRGIAQNQPQVDAFIAEMTARLPMEETVRRAENYLVYVSPGAVEIHPQMAAVSELNAINIFNAQFSLWMQTTIFEAINEANRGSKNVLESPVKHLIQLRVPMNIANPSANNGGAMMSSGTTEEGAATAGPVELKADAAATLAPDYTRGPLGYVSNPMYDPIRVQMILRVDATRLSAVLASMSRNQLIKIRNVSFRTVDVGTAVAAGFFYSRDGSVPLVEVEVDCEVLVLREWLVRYMPDPVKAVFATFGAAAPVAQ